MNAAAAEQPPILEAKRCALCGDERQRPVFRFPAGYYPHERFDTASWDGRQLFEMSIVECEGCGLRFTSPSFREQFLHLVYPPEPLHAPERVRQHFDPSQRKGNSILALAAKHSRPGATLLDIGTRYGGLPFLARERYGFDAHGIEYNAASVQLGRAHFNGISQGTLSDVPALVQRLGWSNVDVAVLDDVVEHLVDPRRDLSTLARSQQPGSLLVLRTMDCGGWGARLFGPDWYYYAPAAHMYYFDAEHLGRLLQAAGYAPLEVQRVGLARNVLALARRTLSRRELSRRLRALGRRQRREGSPGSAAAGPARKPAPVRVRRRLPDDLMLMVARRV